jgi:hypothetical protein
VAANKGQQSDLTRSATYPLVVDRPIARASAWYEMMPRSQSPVFGKHGTFDDCINRLPDIAAMGFDVLYLTHIHPIGRVNCKGRNNSLRYEPGDPGSPYAIGSAEGGHDAVHPELGTLDDFRRFVRACAEHRLRSRTRLCRPVLDRPSLARAAPGMVQAQTRRLDPIRGKPTEKARRHRQSRPLRARQ